MPVLPCQSLGLCRKAKEIINKVSVKSNKLTKRYAVFALLLLEIASIPVAYYKGVEFKDFWYPFFANNIILIMLIKNYCDRITLRYCQRTVLALRMLLVYFTYNTVVLITGLFAEWYYITASYLLLAAIFYTVLLTIYKSKK